METCSQLLAQKKYRYCFINYCIKASHHLRSMPMALSTQWEILFVPKNFWSKEGASLQLWRKKKTKNVYITKLRIEPESHKSKSTHSACRSAKLLPRKSKAGGPQGLGWQWQGYQGLPACIWKLSHELCSWALWVLFLYRTELCNCSSKYSLITNQFPIMALHISASIHFLLIVSQEVMALFALHSRDAPWHTGPLRTKHKIEVGRV